MRKVEIWVPNIEGLVERVFGVLGVIGIMGGLLFLGTFSWIAFLAASEGGSWTKCEQANGVMIFHDFCVKKDAIIGVK